MSPDHQGKSISMTFDESAAQDTEAGLLARVSGQFWAIITKYGGHLQVGQRQAGL